jgi:hypothetical protein
MKRRVLHPIATLGVLGVVGLLLVGSANSARAVVPDANSPRQTRTTAPENTAALRDLPQARARWKAKGPKGSYRYTLSLSCFCPQILNSPVTVRRGKVVSPRKDLPGSERTIPDWFNYIEKTAPSVASLKVVYDPIDGHPTVVSVDVDLRIADEESYFTLGRVRRLRR